MSFLTILAILGIVVGVIALIQERRFNGQRSYAIMAALIAASIALLALAGVASMQKKNARQNVAAQIEPAAQQTADSADAIDAPPVADVDTAIAPDDDKAKALDDKAKAPIVGKTDNAIAQDADETDKAIAQDADKAQAPDDDKALAPIAGETDKAQAPDDDKALAPIADETDKAQAPDVPVKANAAAPAIDKNDPLAPTAVAGNPHDDAKINEVISFTAKRSKKKPKGADIVSYHWDFADGTTAEGRDVKHSFDKLGTYDVVLTIADEDGRRAQDVRRISVNRPESKTYFLRRDIPDAHTPDNPPEVVTGKYAKKFTGSIISIEAEGYMLSADKCECTILVALDGPGCYVSRKKSLSNGGEGTLSVKALCRGDLGDVTWSVTRKASNDCACTFKKWRIEASES